MRPIDAMTLTRSKMTFRRFMGFVAMAFLWTGSQIPVYLFGKPTPQINIGLNLITLVQAVFHPIFIETLVEQIDGSGL
jgi:hypothetical protein